MDSVDWNEQKNDFGLGFSINHLAKVEEFDPKSGQMNFSKIQIRVGSAHLHCRA